MWQKIACCAIFAAASALVLWPPRAARDDLRITFLDVGQGDAIVVQTPRGHTIMFDTGGRLERTPSQDGASIAEAVGERIVVPFLIRQGIHHVDAMILTHPHGDHVGGAAPILRTLAVDRVFDGAQEYGGRAYHDALEEAGRRGVAVLHRHAGDRWQTDDGVVLRFLTSAGAPITETRDPINENSLVIMLECSCNRATPFRALFMGDAGKVSEGLLLARRLDLRADLLKVGHHGSKYASSEEFLAAVHPYEAIISDGRHNLYHHPAPRTLATLARAHATIWRTDRCGAITIDVDKGGVRTGAMLPACGSSD